MKKIYEQADIEFLEFKQCDVVLASILIGTGDNILTDDYDELL